MHINDQEFLHCLCYSSCILSVNPTGIAAAEQERIKEKKREQKSKNRSKGVLIRNSIAKPPPKDMVSSGSLDVMLDASGKDAFGMINSSFEKINSGAPLSSTNRKSPKRRAATSYGGFHGDSSGSNSGSSSPNTKSLKRVASMPNPLNRTSSHSKLTKDATSTGTAVVVKKKRTKKKKKGLNLGFNGKNHYVYMYISQYFYRFM